tara:strand:- start:9104 stop:11548 length:2445 start_codon:yes stop_codon:yes gene_type:complete
MKNILLMTVSLSSLMMTNAASGAQVVDETASGTTEIEEVVTVGSRRKGRTILETPVPVDVLSGAELSSTGSGDLQDVLQTVSPSFNVSRSPVDDGGTFVRTPTLRGLPGGKTLVLVNGKRVHRSALISLSGEQDNKVGSHAVDLSQFPVAAVKRIEVLRDGASAQYGSDAVAGVINIVLKDQTGASAYAQYGQYYKGDGEDFQFGANVGLPLTDKGYVNVTFEYLNSNATSRGVQSPSAQAVIDAGGPGASSVPVPAIVWGLPNREWYRVVYNAGLEVAENTEAYIFGNYGNSNQDGSFFYRDPVNNGAFARSAFQDGPDAIYPDYSLTDRYPGGFTPRFFGNVVDYSVNLGLKGEFDSGLTWDLSGATGAGKVDYTLKNSINPSMGADSPTEFKPGVLVNSEQQINLDFSYPWQVNGLDGPINVAFGSEIRRETYEIRPGDEASWQVGRLTDLGVGSNGFQGFSPAQASKNSRHNVAFYLDVEADLSEDFQVGVAGRFEDFSDFGSTFDGKISARYQISEMIAIRGAASTGFRAPTVGQSNMINTGTSFIDGELIASGILPPTSPIAAYFGGKGLTPENATNFSAGIVLQPADNASITFDYYNIKITDRIGLTSNNTVTDEARAILIGQGVTSAATIGAVRFFTNGYDSRTTGFDIVGNYDVDMGEGQLRFTLGYNYNDTKILGFDPDVLNGRAILNIQNMVPKSKGTLSITYDYGDLVLSARAKYFGSWTFTESNAAPVENAVESGSELTLDISAAYNFAEHYTFKVGVDNLFDNYPDRFYAPGDCCGRVYSGASPYGFDGGFYYARMSANF